MTISKAGSRPIPPVAAVNFTGATRVDRLIGHKGATLGSGGLMHFEAGARTHWHTHPLGQTLIITTGTGRVQHWGGPLQEFRQGDIVRILPNVKHRHGAAPDSAMSHIALSEQLDGKTVDRLEKVEDSQYAPPTPSTSPAAAGPLARSAEPSPPHPHD